MKLWSRGLGKTEIYMDFRYYKTLKDPQTGNILIIGNMQSPVTWEFKITVQPEDIGGVMKALLCPPMLFFTIKNLPQYLVYLFNRNKYKLKENIVEKVNSTYEQIMTGGRVHYREPDSLSSKSTASQEV